MSLDWGRIMNDVIVATLISSATTLSVALLGMWIAGRKRKKDILEIVSEINRNLGEFTTKDPDVKNKLDVIDQNISQGIGQVDASFQNSMSFLSDSLGSVNDPLSKKQITVHGMIESIKERQDLEIRKREQFSNLATDNRIKQSELALDIVTYTTKQAQELTIKNGQLIREVERLKDEVTKLQERVNELEQTGEKRAKRKSREQNQEFEM